MLVSAVEQSESALLHIYPCPLGLPSHCRPAHPSRSSQSIELSSLSSTGGACPLIFLHVAPRMCHSQSPNSSQPPLPHACMPVLCICISSPAIQIGSSKLSFFKSCYHRSFLLPASCDEWRQYVKKPQSSSKMRQQIGRWKNDDAEVVKRDFVPGSQLSSCICKLIQAVVSLAPSYKSGNWGSEWVSNGLGS